MMLKYMTVIKQVINQAFFLLFVSNFAYSTPSISSLSSSSVDDGDSIVITGSSFGTGPTVEIYDQFEGTEGADIPLNGCQVGDWGSYL